MLILGSLRCEAQAVTGYCAANQGARTASSQSTKLIYRIEFGCQVGRALWHTLQMIPHSDEAAFPVRFNGEPFSQRKKRCSGRGSE